MGCCYNNNKIIKIKKKQKKNNKNIYEDGTHYLSGSQVLI
jgi:hypothetical protein